MERRWIIIAVLLAVAAIVADATFFTVSQTEQALVLEFGQPRRVVREPGLRAKIPFMQNVVLLDRRVLDIDPPVENAILADQKRLEVDAYARYRIADPLLFYQSLGNEAQARLRLSIIVNSAMRRVLGNVTLSTILSPKREQVMADIRAQVNQEALRLGIEIVDVRLRRADLPDQTSQAVFSRMASERAREAAEARAQGQEMAQEIRARADRDRVVLLAEAQKQAQVIRGEADNEAGRVMNAAIARNPEFYSLYRSLQAYRDTLKPDDTTLVLTPQSDFLRFLAGPHAGGK